MPIIKKKYSELFRRIEEKTKEGKLQLHQKVEIDMDTDFPPYIYK